MASNLLFAVLFCLILIDDSIGFAPHSSRASNVRGLSSSTEANPSDDNNDQRLSLPKIIIFDLDGCLWQPEMFELLYFSGGAGAPFTSQDDNNDGNNILLTAKGEPVHLLGNVRDVMRELYTDPKWKTTLVGISSRTDQPDWARELLTKFQVPTEDEKKALFVLQDVFDGGPMEISHESKVEHFRRISTSLGIPFEDMLFLDNEYWNCKDVSELGVTVGHCPEGVTMEIWKAALEAFPAQQGEVVKL
jgi:magnesium-dependent phosphatase 1